LSTNKEAICNEREIFLKFVKFFEFFLLLFHFEQTLRSLNWLFFCDQKLICICNLISKCLSVSQRNGCKDDLFQKYCNVDINFILSYFNNCLRLIRFSKS
jgi:hypothetical protein